MMIGVVPAQLMRGCSSGAVSVLSTRVRRTRLVNGALMLTALSASFG